MSKNYNQLSLEQRYQIEALFQAGIKQKLIAELIDVHPSTVCRELKRNIACRGQTAGKYKAANAQRKTGLRHQNKAKRIIFTDKIKSIVSIQLKNDKWSPELITNTAKLNGKTTVSHEWIYQWIWECKHSNTKENRQYKNLYKYLKHCKRRRKRGNRKDNRGVILNRTPIDKRPSIVDKRKRLGDLEIDLMMGKNHKAALLVLTDRASLHTRIKKLSKKDCISVKKGIISCLKKNKYKPQTLTFDNDLAFSRHQEIANYFKVSTYFTRPYTSQDKGTVENRIGVIRRFFPKKTNLIFVTDKQVNEVEKMLNNRPIRKFNYLTANQVLLEKIALIT
ncbi:MAG: IS30 family transposase [Bacteroidota bacterium]|nr:IS30 family transposase [Bacteroidota bacterium]